MNIRDLMKLLLDILKVRDGMQYKDQLDYANFGIKVTDLLRDVDLQEFNLLYLFLYHKK